MKMTVYRLTLPLARPFTIARGTRTIQHSLIVRLEHAGVCGFGEVTGNSYYGHPVNSIAASLERLRDRLHLYESSDPEIVWPEMMTLTGGDTFAVCAVDMAAHDLHGHLRNQPVWKLSGLNWTVVPRSSLTIGIGSPDGMTEMLNAHSGWTHFKIKLGTPQDLERVAALRQCTNAVFRVDANGSWSADETIAKSHQLRELGVELIEQPLPPEASPDDKQRVFRESALPVIADEDCRQEADVDRCLGLYHGINIKLCKCGGLTPALRMLRRARELRMKTMVGCMIESSIGISGSCHLLPLLDFADLDGAILLRDEPCFGVRIRDGFVERPDGPGIGAGLNAARLAEFQSAQEH